MNKQFGVGGSKYVVVSDPLLLVHVIRRMRSDRIYSPAKVNEELFAYFFTADEASL